jgi:myxalamid-type polyketide synthase MxaE and MxaD
MSADFTQQLRQAVKAIDKLQTRIGELEAERERSADAIAVIGVGCRFPGGANGPDAYWDLLSQGKDAIREVPPDRWSVDEYYDADPAAPGKISTRFGGFVDGLADFDAELFGIAPREAVSLDPQHRLLLEVSWEALEHAGISPLGLAGSRTGVFAGLSSTDYAQLLAGRGNSTIDAYLGSGTAHSTATGRISYTLGLEGPNMAIDTACSSALVAVHQACNSLRAGECDLALAGGVNAMITPTVAITFSKARMLAPDGRCKTFDAAADGYVRGEGCGIVVLKRLRDARRDGDPVLAVIRGSAVNQDGASSGLTVPNGPAQERVIRAALQQAGIEPGDVSYLEAHGTGTSLGDPIEVQAAAAVFSRARDPKRPLLIGSVKTNIGHLEAASGIAGLIKVVLALGREEIPASLHFRNPSPHIPWEQIPVRVASAPAMWPEGRRVAGVSAFGFSGTNAHVVLEAFPAEPTKPTAVQRTHHLLLLSAKSHPALLEMARQYGSWLRGDASMDLSDFCHTAGAGRARFEERGAIVAATHDEAVRLLDALAADSSTAGLWQGMKRTPPKCAWMFTGQGSQYPGMARRVYETEPVFRALLDRCDKLLSAEFKLPLLSTIFDADASRIDDTAVAQPAIFAVEMGLAELWRSWGIEPDVVLGHSVGQYAAACFAGVFSLEDGLRLIARRGQLMSELPRNGKMAAIFTPAAGMREVLAGFPQLAMAADNGGHSVISGDAAGVDSAVRIFEERGVICRSLATSHAFHSPLIEPALDAFEAVARGIDFRPARLTLICNLTGQPLAGGQTLDAAYWRRHARQPVEFSRSIAAVARLGCKALVEIGPDAVLSTLVRRCWPKSSEAPLCVPSLRRGQNETEQLAKALGQLFVAGLPVEAAAWQRGRKLRLPTYPFQRRRYWIETAPRERGAVAAFYDALGATPMGQQGPAFLTFGPLPQRIPGFSWLLTWVQPEKHREHVTLVLEAQSKLREALFHHVRFERVTRALDFGCGISTDLISLAKSHPHLQLDGYTISAEQVAEGRRRAAENGIAGRVSLFHADSGKDPFPARYQLIFGFEVAHYIRDKPPLFSNIGTHLEDGGLLVLADFLSTTDVRIEHAETGSWFSNVDEWVSLLSSAGLRLIEAIDVSKEVGNFLHDEDFETHFAQLAEIFPGIDSSVASHTRSYHQLGRMLSRDIARYLLLTARKESTFDPAELERINRAKLTGPVGYSAWLSKKTDAGLLYEFEWLPCVKQRRRDAAPAPANWIFSRGGALADALTARGHQCVMLTDPIPEGAAIGGIVHCCDPADDLEPALRSLLGLVHTCDRSDRLKQAPIWIITSGAHQTGAVNPTAAAVWGLGRAIARERSASVCRLVDLGQDGSLAQLIDEITSPGTEDELAFRGDAAFVPRMKRVPAVPGIETPVQSDGAYLVTGATGALGLETVKWLARRGAGSVVCVARRAPRDPLAISGCDIQWVEADVSSAAEIDAVLTGIRSTKKLRGVIHAAGVIEDALLAQQDRDRFERVLRPKAGGAWLLHERTLEDPLDFFVLYSSLTSVLGSPGQANYVAANAFLDGLAHLRRQMGLPALSVNWGLWGDSATVSRWPNAVREYERRGGVLLESEAAFQALEQLLAEGRAQAVVASVDWAKFAGAAPGQMPAPVRDLIPAPATTGIQMESPVRDRLQSLVPRQRRAALELFLQQELADVLQLEKLPDADVGFFDLGLDSLMAVEYRNQVQRALRLDPPPAATIAFDYPSVAQLTDKLASQILNLPAPRTRQAAAEAAARTDEGIAVVGFSCRFPGAKDAEAFRLLLEQGRDAIGEIPAARWNADAYYDPDPSTPGRMYTRFAGTVEGIDQFDAGFFGVSPREAAAIDPQQRMLLELSWETLEHGGIAPASVAGTRTGVFVGISTHDYFHLASSQPDMQNEALLSMGNAFSTAAGRISHFLGLEGPCEAIDTACSSSLVAVSHACDGLQNGRCDLALAGGVNAILSPAVMVNLSKTGMLAPGGRCRTFDASAEGYGRGEGSGMVLLKRVSDARRDGDRIFAVIRGTAVNHDGAASGLTVPNGPAQQRVIRDALKRAGVEPAEVAYLEVHGTGTPLGDPIEVQAAAAVYGEDRDAAKPLLIGSVKTNIGHLEAAAGIAGLLKVVLSLQEPLIPRHLHFRTPNPHLDWDRLPVRVVEQPTAWPAGQRIAAVSSFGFSGTNAHIVIEGPAAANGHVDSPAAPALLVLSARSTDALARLAGRYRVWLQAHPDADLAEFCNVAATGRSHFEERAAAVVDSREAAIRVLDVLERGETMSGIHRGKQRTRASVAWFFTGADDFAAQMEIAARWQSWGIEPDVVFGEGSGAVAAACVAGVVSGQEEPQRTLLRGDSGRPMVAGEPICREPAELDRCFHSLAEAGCSILMEIGSAAQQVDGFAGTVLRVNSAAEEADALSQLYTAGWTPDFVARSGRSPRRFSLPTYPFERRRYWLSEAAPAPASAMEGATSEEALRAHIAELVQRALALEQPPDPTLDFLELGMDSMIATELTRRLQEELGGTLSSTLVLDHRNVEKLAAYLAQHNGSQHSSATPATNGAAPGISFWKRFAAPEPVAAVTDEMIGPVPIQLGPAGAHGPAIRIYHPPDEIATGAGIVICPGGGYATLAMDTEGHQVARWLNSTGITAIVVSYRVAPAYRYPVPVDDVKDALHYVRQHAGSLGLDENRVGLMGFSAGGHLASLVAVGSERPDFLILGYPVISMIENCNLVTRRNLLGENPSRELLESLSSDRLVNSQTPPAFLFHTGEDAAVAAEHTLSFYAALRRAKVPVEMHLYQYGPHGAGLAPGDPVLSTWKERLLDWMRTSGFLCDGERVRVEGEVTVGGKPLRFGTITFVPNRASMPTAWGPVAMGKYSIPASRGPLPGSYHAEIRRLGDLASHPTIESAELVDRRPMTIESGDNTFVLEIPLAARAGA